MNVQVNSLRTRCTGTQKSRCPGVLGLGSERLTRVSCVDVFAGDLWGYGPGVSGKVDWERNKKCKKFKKNQKYIENKYMYTPPAYFCPIRLLQRTKNGNVNVQKFPAQVPRFSRYGRFSGRKVSGDWRFSFVSVFFDPFGRFSQKVSNSKNVRNFSGERVEKKLGKVNGWTKFN